MSIVYLDTETTGLDPRADELVLVAFGIGNRVSIFRHPRDRDAIQAVLDRDARFCAHNIVFDMSMLSIAGGYVTPSPKRWLDTTLLAHVAGERKAGENRLSRLAAKLIELERLPGGILEPERELKRWLVKARREAKKNDRPRPEIGHAPSDLLNPYVAADVVTSRAVAEHYGARVNGQTSILRLEHACLPAIYAAEQRGVPVELDAALELRDRTASNVAGLRARVHELAGGPFNLNSARQIEQALLARGADVSAIPRTEKAQLPMFTAQTLAQVDDELARALEAYRDEKSLADYVANLYQHTHGDRLYGHFRQVGTETGRMASSGPNLQNIPKSDLRVRYVIRAAPDHRLVGADLDNVELRVLACYAPGGALARALADGADLHQQTADAVGVDRDAGKTLNYAILYGAGVPRIAAQLGVDRDEAHAILNRWYRTYPEVARLKARLARTIRRRGYLKTILGRRHYFDQPNHMMLNRLVSGTCADLFKRAIVLLHRAGVPMVLYVHDEVVADVHEDDVDHVARLLELALTRPQGVIGGLVAEATVAERWSDFKEPGWTPERREEVKT